MSVHCPLCNGIENKAIEGVTQRIFLQCAHCFLIFSEPQFFISADEEKSRYALHNNSITDKGYVNFLNQAITPSLAYINESMKGLDYGCGPGPTLSLLLNQRNIECDNYDPFFFAEIKKSSYDFIFATECFEHFHRPLKQLQHIDTLLKPKGILSVLTDRWENEKHFANWYYTKDPTHVCFYHEKTFDFICQNFAFKLLHKSTNRLVILEKQ
jgi:SAM-dependent methyltransferase